MLGIDAKYNFDISRVLACPTTAGKLKDKCIAY